MVENLLKRAKDFIGLGEEEVESENASRQLNFSQPVKREIKRERRQVNSEEGEYEIVVYEPKVYEDSLGISQHLRNGNPVIINLKHLEPNEGTRLIDFVCGTAYAIDGHMLKIADSIFLFSPGHVFISDIEGKQRFEEPVEEEDTGGGGNKFFSRG